MYCLLYTVQLYMTVLWEADFNIKENEGKQVLYYMLGGMGGRAFKST